MSPLGRRKWKFPALLVLLAGSAGVFVAFGPPRLVARTETPLYCSSCHVMESEFEAWFHVGAHRTIRCVDCHLPHETLPAYYVWKSIDGIRDLVISYSGQTPETITLSARGETFVQANCVRCHAERVAVIDQERNCWDCHRFLQHLLAGSRLTS